MSIEKQVGAAAAAPEKDTAAPLSVPTAEQGGSFASAEAPRSGEGAAPQPALPGGVDLSRFALAREALAPAAPKPKAKKKPRASRCDDCEFFDTDEWGDGVCSISLDEDEMAEFVAGHTGRCPYYRYYNEYKSVQKQN